MTKTLLIIFIIFIVLEVIKLLIGPTIWDRLLALNLITSLLIIFIVIYASMNKNNFALDLALIYSLLGFIGIIFISIYIEHRGRL